MISMQGASGLVTASGDGIGRASALAFAAAGANVLVSDLDDDTGQETVRLIREAGGTAEYRHADAAIEDDAAALVATVVKRWGALNFAHNNAGISTVTKPITDQAGADWERILAINLIGVMYGMKHQMRQMQDQGKGGAIVNTASTAGLSGSWGLSPYVSSKWALIGLTKTGAVEGAAAAIRVNAICPGATMTTALRHWSQEVPEQFQTVIDAIPLGRGAESEEQANAAVWLCSPGSSYITGVALAVDGGLTIPR